MTKQLINLLQNNIKFNNAPNEYIIYMNKHITADIRNKHEVVKQQVARYNGEVKVIKEPYIKGVNYEMIIEIIADVSFMQEFDKAIENNRR